MTVNNQRHIIITGACGGIGRQLVQQFLSEGFIVHAIDKSSELDDSPQVVHHCFDLYDFVKDSKLRVEETNRIIKSISVGSLCAVINNAAEQIVKPIEAISYEDWDRTLAVNVVAPFMLTQIFLPFLEISHGAVVNISSIHSNLTKSNFAVYATSKSALSGLTRLMSVELGSRIRVNAIEPGAISTQMLESGFSNNPERRLLLDKFHPTSRIGEPSEVASLASFLVSSQANFINGSIITIDGGISNVLHDPSSL